MKIIPEIKMDWSAASKDLVPALDAIIKVLYAVCFILAICVVVR